MTYTRILNRGAVAFARPRASASALPPAGRLNILNWRCFDARYEREIVEPHGQARGTFQYARGAES